MWSILTGIQDVGVALVKPLVSTANQAANQVDRYAINPTVQAVKGLTIGLPSTLVPIARAKDAATPLITVADQLGRRVIIDSPTRVIQKLVLEIRLGLRFRRTRGTLREHAAARLIQRCVRVWLAVVQRRVLKQHKDLDMKRRAQADSWLSYMVRAMAGTFECLGERSAKANIPATVMGANDLRKVAARRMPRAVVTPGMRVVGARALTPR